MNPNTVVTLYATDFDISNKYVVKAESEGEALGAVGSFPSKVYPDCYWQRDASAFRATGNINDVKKYNYCTFENNGKINFAFITDYTYINDDMTLCHIDIDPWLNYAGQYVFNDSPMIRCHPKEDTVLEGSFVAEPIQIVGWKQENKSAGYYAEGDSDDMFLVTQIDTSTVPDNGDNLWEGIYNIISYYGSGAGPMKQWGTMALKTSPCRVGSKVQATTYHVNRGMAGTILSRMTANGLGDKVVCAYSVPSYLGSSLVPKQLSPVSLINTNFTMQEIVNILWGGYTIFWNKIKYSPQFNQLILNLAGNSKEIPWGFINSNILIGSGQLTASIKSDMSCDGSASCKIEELDISSGDSSDFIVKSPIWDRVQMVGTGANQNKLVQTEVAYIKGVVGSVLSAFAGNAPSAGLNVLSDTIQNSAKVQNIFNEGVVSTGGLQGSIASYNLNAPLFNATHYFPKEPEMVRLQQYFGTYGYSWNGKIKPIEFGYMPYWNYYETEDASITGKSVPQKDLMKIINRFNRGIFIFNTIGDYKKFGNSIANHP